MAEARDSSSERRRDSVANTFGVAIGVSLVCSLLVASTAVLLKPAQQTNRERYEQRIVLEVAGLYAADADIERLFERIDTRVVDLASGAYVDRAMAAEDAEQLVEIPPDQDIAGIRRRPRFVPVYLEMNDAGSLEQVILPVYGSGLWSTLRGYLALTADGQTVRGLRFYEHAETPGLGDQIDAERWLEQWSGKQVFSDAGTTRLEVVRGRVPPGAAAAHQVDGLSGATLTGRGVTNLLRYWTGPHGFGPYLNRLRGGDDDGQ